MKVVILTASPMKKVIDGRTFSGKCVTAFDIESNKIVRLVGNEQGAPMENPFCNNYNPLDMYEITIRKRCPLLCQTENVLPDFNTAKYLGKYTGSIHEIRNLYLSNNCLRPSYMFDGSNLLTDISKYNHSIEIIMVDNLMIDGRKCSFEYNNIRFTNFSVTDDKYRNEQTPQNIGKAFIVVSIPTSDYNGYYYKFVASVFPL